MKNMKHLLLENTSETDRKPNPLYQVVKTDRELSLFFTTMPMIILTHGEG